MADAIDNLVNDLNQANAVDEFPGYPGYKMGDLVPGMAGVRIGDFLPGYDAYGQEAPYNWRTGAFEFQAAPQEIDFNIRDQPVERINIGVGDEQDAFVPGGVYTPGNQQQYITGGNVLVPPGNLGGTVGVVGVNPADFAGQTPSSVPEGITSGGGNVGRTFEDFTQKPDYSVPIGFMDNGDIIMANKNNIRDTVIVPSGRTISESELEKGVLPNLTIPKNWNEGINTALAPSQKTPTSVGAYDPSTLSEGGFDMGSEGALDLPSGGGGTGTGAIDITPDWKEEAEEKGDKATPPYSVVDPTAVPKVNPYVDPRTGVEFPADQDGNRWNFIKGEWDMAKPPGKDTGTTTTPPAGGGTGTGTGTGTKPPTGGGTGTGTGTGASGRPVTGGGYIRPNPVQITGGTPFGANQQVIPTKPLRQVPLPDRQADPFEKLYADLLANSQQQNQYRYINYDPDAIMNAAMRSFRSRGAMRSLQG